MGLKEEDIIFTRKDEQGNTVMRFPITRVENVERAVVTVEGLKPASGNVALPVMAGATATAAGKKGDVPAPAKGDQAKALLGSGKFGFPSNLATTRYFNGVAFNGGADVVNYGVCSTAAATAAKVVACAGFALKTGAHILVKFTVTNTVTPTAAAPLTLNVNNTGAKSIFYHGSAAFTASYVSANRVIEFVYDGTQYAVVGDWDSNTRYSNITGALNADRLCCFPSSSGAFHAKQKNHNTARYEDANVNWNFDFSASWSDGIYGSSSTVQSPSIQILIIIKV